MIVVEVQQAARSLRRQAARRVEERRAITPCVMTAIDYADKPDVAGRPGYVWVRELSDGTDECGGVVPVLNPGNQAACNLPVLVGRAPRAPWERQVLCTDLSLLADSPAWWNQPFNVPQHGRTHTILRGRPDPQYGADPAWVTAGNLIDLMVYPTSPPSMRLVIAPGVYVHGSELKPFPGALTADLTAHLPAAGQARLLFVLIDGATNTVEYLAGPAFDCAVPFVDPVPSAAWPVITAGRVVAGAPLLYPGLTAIAEAQFRYDVKPLLRTVGYGALGDLSDVGTATPTAGNILEADGDSWEAVAKSAVNAADFGSGAATDGQVLTADGAGGAAFEAPSSSNLDWFNVKDYGAIGDGTTDDTAAINTAIAALDAGGYGVLYFPPGTYKSAGGHTLANPTMVLGCGMASTNGTGAITQINCTSATASLFTVSAYKASFSHLALKNTAGASPSAGAGITVIGTDLAARTDYDHVSVFGFYIDIDVQVSALWTMNSCFIIAPVLYGLKIRNTINCEAGDWCVSNTNFMSSIYNAAAAIRIQSSGGGKIINVKTVGPAPGMAAGRFVHDIDVAVDTNVYSTDLLIANTSLEGYSGNGINITTTTGTSKWDKIVITGLEIAANDNTTGYPISMVGNASGDILYITINGIVCQGGNGAGQKAIRLTNVDHAYLSGIVIWGFPGGVLSETTCNDIVLVTGDHGDLVGLADDDHPHYLTTARHALVDHAGLPGVGLGGQYRQFVYEPDGAGSFNFITDGDGNPLFALLDLE